MSEIVTATPNWAKPIVRVPMNQAFPQLGEVREFKNRVCLFSEDRSTLFDVVSPRYNVLEHGKAVRAVEEAMVRIFGKGKAPTLNVRTFKSGARLVATCKLPLPPIKIDTDLKLGDVMELGVTLRNSYDRSCAFTAEGSASRLACTNGMRLSRAFGQVTARHIAGADEAEDGMGDVILDQLGNIIHRMPMVKERWERWTVEKITLQEAELMVAGWLPAKYAEPLLDEAKWGNNGERTMWAWYNELTAMATHRTDTVQRRIQFDEMIGKLFYSPEDDVDVTDSMIEA